MNHVMTHPIQTAAPIYRLKVALDHIAPPIWRRFQVPGDVTLSQLHRILQDVMGWMECHLYKFEIAGNDYGPPDEFAWGMMNDRKARLEKVAGIPGTTFAYHYDFGDGWEHEIVVERIGAPEPGATYPHCVDGARACPPEDCGGIPGYEHLTMVLTDSNHPDHAELLEWVGGSYDPEAFDVEAINRRLRRLRSLA